jgi:NADH-quinone oxidoreductase subunit J
VGLNISLLILLVISGLWTVMSRSLLRSALGLALTSGMLAIIMFRLDSGLAAVFELSVCTGLISVLFISTISLTHPLSKEEKQRYIKERLSRFWFLPFIVIIAGILAVALKVKLDLELPARVSEQEVRFVLWNLRQTDLVGQIIILLTGVFGVVILFKEGQKK